MQKTTKPEKKNNKSKEKKEVTSQCTWCWRENGHRSDKCRKQPGGDWYDEKAAKKTKPSKWVDRPDLQTSKKVKSARRHLGKEMEEKKQESETEDATSDDDQTVSPQVVNLVRLRNKNKTKKVLKAKIRKAGIPQSAQSKLYYASNKNKKENNGNRTFLMILELISTLLEEQKLRKTRKKYMNHQKRWR